MQTKKNIAVIGGGNSSEYIISVQSAQQVAQMIDSTKYNVYPIKIVGNEWCGVGGEIENIPVNKADFTLTINGVKIVFDCAFIVIHGTPGEDGRLQSYFELLNIPYTTPGVFPSALTFNKLASKLYLREFNIAYAKTKIFKKGQKINAQKLVDELGLPMFVKPNEAGSSFGVSKVNSLEELPAALEYAFKEDNQILVEEYLKGREFTCGIFKTATKTLQLPVTEIISENDFFDYDAKYTGKSKEITPAELTPAQEQKCKELTAEIYDIFNCNGIVRVDYILMNDTFYFLEVNTVPGMSKNSIIPQQIRALNLNPGDVFTEVIEDAISRLKKH